MIKEERSELVGGWSITESTKRWALLAGTLVAVVLSWELLSRFLYTDLQIIFPSTVTVLREFYDLTASGSVFPHLYVSGRAILVAVILAIVVGIPLATLVGTNQYVAEGVEPLLYYFSTIPKIVLLPLIIIAFGIGFESRVAIGFLSAIFPIAVNVIVGTLQVERNHINVARSFGASPPKIFSSVYLPSLVIPIVNGVRLGMGVAIISVLLSELFASQMGLGNQISLYFNQLQVARMYGVLLLVFAIALVLNLALMQLQRYLSDLGYGDVDSNTSFGF
jgi:ABC-type nitrate/sulfonate/bicarbonate transport system permease component